MSQATSRQATASITSWPPIPNRLSTSRLQSATLLLSRLTHKYSRSPPKSPRSCGRASNIEILTKELSWATRHKEPRRTISTQRSWRGYVRQSTTCTWQTSPSTLMPWTAAECSSTLNSQAAEQGAAKAVAVKHLSVTATKVLEELKMTTKESL